MLGSCQLGADVELAVISVEGNSRYTLFPIIGNTITDVRPLLWRISCIISLHLEVGFFPGEVFELNQVHSLLVHCLAVRDSPREVDDVVILVIVVDVSTKQRTISSIMRLHPGIHSKVAAKDQIVHLKVCLVAKEYTSVMNW